MMTAVEKNGRSGLGANVRGSGIAFKVWAPLAERVAVRWAAPRGRADLLLESAGRGYFTGAAAGAAGERYWYVLNDKELCPDPASRFQPEGVHGPSQIIDANGFAWGDEAWRGIPLADFIIYELHAGTFTGEGTFAAIIPRLDYLRDLGVTAIELMPVAQFPGGRNWGYDGVYPFAPQNSYGGPEGLKGLINAAHGKGLAVVLDVVYNHLGPEGNTLHRFGPYFTDSYRTPWGAAINFDGPGSDEVRDYFIANALYWITEYHIDALRLDAIHGIYDFSARHFLEELKEAVDARAGDLGRQIFLTAESALNDARVIKPADRGGYGLDSQWNDDFHHALHTLLTGERLGYYQDFGTIADLEKAFREGYVYSGQYSRYRQRRHGNSALDRPARQFIVFSQCHDQVGNRMAGDRLSQTLPLEKLKLAAGAVILSPYLPLLFMGEEYGETAPFPYFISHSDRDLVAAVRAGRKSDFASFRWEGEVPDPQGEETFLSAKLDIGLSGKGVHKALFEFYRELLRLRKAVPALRQLRKENMEVRGFEEKRALFVRRWCEDDEIFILYHFGETILTLDLPLPEGRWEKILASASPRWGGEDCPAGERLPGGGSGNTLRLQPASLVLYRRGEGG
jgi:maltooligosyltrehalose trehalohydrolase